MVAEQNKLMETEMSKTTFIIFNSLQCYLAVCCCRYCVVITGSMKAYETVTIMQIFFVTILYKLYVYIIYAVLKPPINHYLAQNVNENCHGFLL